MSPAAMMLRPRDVNSVISSVNGVRETYTSWDACMSKTYCKWPVIIGIVIVSLILLSILWCAFRCLCCGLQCCCGCLSCFNSCCPGPRRKQNHSTPPPPYNAQAFRRVPSAQYSSAPQFATFETSSSGKRQPVSDDALPEMPSWANATEKHVEDTTPDTEMDNLKHTSDPQNRPFLAADGRSYSGHGQPYTQQSLHSQPQYRHPGRPYPSPMLTQPSPYHMSDYGYAPSVSPAPSYSRGPSYATSPYSAPAYPSNSSQQYAPLQGPGQAMAYSPYEQPPPPQQQPQLGSWRNV